MLWEHYFFIHPISDHLLYTRYYSQCREFKSEHNRQKCLPSLLEGNSQSTSISVSCKMRQGKSVAVEDCGGGGAAILYSRMVREDLNVVTCELGASERDLTSPSWREEPVGPEAEHT